MSNQYTINKTDEAKANSILLEIGIERAAKVAVSLKNELLQLTEEEVKALKRAGLFNPKHTPTKRIARLEKIIRGWPNGPQTILARIEEMASKIQIGLKHGNKNITETKASQDEVVRRRTDWTLKRRSELLKRYALESADEVQLECLCNVEYKLLELNRQFKINSVADVDRMTALVDLQNSLMKSLGITRSDRKKLKEETSGKETWESMVRSFDENRSEKYKEAEADYLMDKRKLREREDLAKKELEDMGFRGE
jgi:hypothetical protein